MTNGNSDEGHGLGSEIKSFGALLGGVQYFKIPGLQRPFQWGVIQVGDMVGDLMAAYEGRYKYYFLGHIIVVEGDGDVVEIIDGQQRFTTFTILLAYLRDAFATDQPELSEYIQRHVLHEDRARLFLRQTDAEFLRMFVQEPGRIAEIAADYSKTPAHFVAGTDAQQNIIQAAKQITEKLSRLGKAPLAEFTHFILNRAIVGVMTAHDRTGAAMTIRGMNMRGQHMSPADIIKLEAIGASGLSPEQQDQAARVWDSQEDLLGAEDFAFLLEILPLLVSRQETRRPGDVQEWRKHAFANVDPAELLIEALPHYAAIFRELMMGEILPEQDDKASVAYLADANRRLKGLLFLRERLWVAPAIAAVVAVRGSPQFLSMFFQGLERLAFGCLLNAVRYESRPERFAAIMRAGVDKTQLQHAFTMKDSEIDAMWERLQEPFGREQWRRRAIAFRADAALPGGGLFTPKDDVTVEHILPSAFNKNWDRWWRPKEAAVCSDLLGNFAILTDAQNKAASGRKFEEKLKVYFEYPGAPLRALTGNIRGYAEWTEDVVRTRTRQLAERLFLDWGLHN